MPKFIAASIVIALLILLASGLVEFGHVHAGLIDPLQDADNDGCTITEELGSDPKHGGSRDPGNPSDFYDVNLDGTVDLPNDILGVILAFAQGPAGPDYTVMKDRSPPPTAAEEPDPTKREAWDMGPPDEFIDLPNDILGVILQFGHRCDDIEWCGGDVKDGVLLSTEPLEAAPGDFWRDCFTLYRDDGTVVDYLAREISVDESSEQVTAEEASALGLSAPSPQEGWALGLAPMELASWTNWTCRTTLGVRNLYRQAVMELTTTQRFTTTPYTNIVWPPSPAEAYANAGWGWSVDREAEAVTYPIAWYSIPDNIVSVGETHSSARFELNFSVLGVSVNLAERTLNDYIKFNYVASGSPCHYQTSPH